MPRDDTQIRRPAVAGAFYSGEAGELRDEIAAAFHSPLGPGALPEVRADGPRRVLGLVVPHAGYVYSGPGAAWGFAEAARDGRPGAVVLLGVNHRGYGAPIALSPDAAWRTPLGEIPVATALGERLCAFDAEVIPDARAHAQEHSLEVQVPFLQVIFGDVPILPILLGHAGVPAVLRLGEALAVLAREADLLIVASTDFSHYVTQATATRLDRLALDAIAAVNPRALIEAVSREQITMCGVLPVAALLAAGQALGATATI